MVGGTEDSGGAEIGVHVDALPSSDSSSRVGWRKNTQKIPGPALRDNRSVQCQRTQYIYSTYNLSKLSVGTVTNARDIPPGVYSGVKMRHRARARIHVESPQI